jgi:DNA ligase-1
VDVGSGFSMEERMLFKADPSLIIGKTITLKYFQESQDENGKLSLRFPTYKGIRNYE